MSWLGSEFVILAPSRTDLEEFWDHINDAPLNKDAVYSICMVAERDTRNVDDET